MVAKMKKTPTGSLPDPALYRDLFPFSPHFMNNGGLRYHYIDEGSGDPIVMLHGNPTWSFYYRRLIHALSPRYRTIAPDHIGCGLSEKPASHEYDYTLSSRVADFGRFLDHLDVKENITLVLHDWGGMIGMAWAVRNPERISRIVLMNTAAFFPPSGKSLPIRLRVIRDMKWLSTPAVLGLNLFAGSALYMAVNKPLSPEVKSGLIAPYNSWKNRIATLQFVLDIPIRKTDPAFSLVKSVENRLPSLNHIPFLICWGAHDFVFDIDYFNEWRQRFPRAQIHLFQDAGHYVLEDAPERVTGLVKRFMEQNRLENK
jgi:cis-3-alkyl-4-acyloxetan-2-one decarboxylase